MILRKSNWLFAFVICSLFIFVATGCSLFAGRDRTRNYSSVVEYLYPGKDKPVAEQSVPRLVLPLRVAIAFVPGTGLNRLPEAKKMELMEKVSSQFAKLPIVDEIELIPSTYLMPRGSFSNLDQIHTMYGTDVIALISYDQVQHTDEGLLSIFYWTLVGLYAVQGEKNDTSTMLDAAVYHIPSRKMLFRAPGISQVSGSATPINLSEELRDDSYEGFELAASDLVTNLSAQLESFKKKVKERPEKYEVVKTEKYVRRTGGGSLGWPIAMSLLALGAVAIRGDGRRSRR